MLWDLIRDYFVIHVFGGVTAGGVSYDACVGYLDTGGRLRSTNFRLSVGDYFISIGDWLSTTATIISLVIIVLLCCFFIKKMVSSVVNLMSR